MDTSLHHHRLASMAHYLTSTATYLGAALVLCLSIHGKELLDHFDLQVIIQRCVIVFRAAGLGVRKEGDHVKGMTLTSLKSKVKREIHSWTYRSTPFQEQVLAEGPLPTGCVN